MKFDQSIKEINMLSKEASNEGIILLKNDNDLLPFRGKVSVFGRIQFNYYKSGTGSGGLVNTDKVYSIFDIFSASPLLDINKELSNLYKNYVKEHPYNHGSGTWASEPWAQEEMEIREDVVKSARSYSDTAIVVVGRTAGEDKDFFDGEGSYRLSTKEIDLIKKVKKHFDNTILILNTGNIIDLKDVVGDFKAILLCFHGGFYGALSIHEVLTGLVNPSGKLPDTFLKELPKINFGTKDVIYEEDIYVGYRYHNTFDKENILYPFGHGLSYTTFSVEDISYTIEDLTVSVNITVKNTGSMRGKQTYLFTLKQPQGKLGKPDYVLTDFFKTDILEPGEMKTYEIDIYLTNNLSFDDMGHIKKGHMVLEKGLYTLFLSTYMGDESHPFSFKLDEYIFDVGYIDSHLIPFERIKRDEHGHQVKEHTLKGEVFSYQHTENPKPYTKNNHTLEDVYLGKVSLDTFIEGLTDEDLTHLVKGEGMSSPKVTPGIAGAIGGITDSLKSKKIPIVGLADGPSGIRMDSGFKASSIPNATLLASTFNTNLVEDLYTLIGSEMSHYHIDALLAPGMNIHRHPLCGRNFEYFSEDPLLTGYMAAATIKGLNHTHKFGSLKHFAVNNQEYKRFENDVTVSLRALMEIYLMPFWISIAEGANLIMTSYNYLNGYHAAAHPSLTDHLLRDVMGFDGVVITDWWAHTNKKPEPLDKSGLSKMITSRNDIYMVVSDTKTYQDDLLSSLKDLSLQRSDLVIASKNILKMILKSNAMARQMSTLIPQVDYHIESTIKEVCLNHEEIGFSPGKGVYELENHDALDIQVKGDDITIYEGAQGIIIKDKELLYYLIKVDKEETLEVKEYISVDINDGHFEETILRVNESSDLLNYQLNIKTSAKYIIRFSIQNKDMSLSQNAISLYVDETYYQTLSYGSFEGILNSQSFIVLEKGLHTLTIDLRKGKGLEILKLVLLRHG